MLPACPQDESCGLGSCAPRQGPLDTHSTAQLAAGAASLQLERHLLGLLPTQHTSPSFLAQHCPSPQPQAGAGQEAADCRRRALLPQLNQLLMDASLGCATAGYLAGCEMLSWLSLVCRWVGGGGGRGALQATGHCSRGH